MVDDGSTDGSPALLRGYADRVDLVLTENATQRVAANRGYERTTGDVVVFLDSDDVLPADLAERLAEAWAPTVSKAQFRMQRIDERGVPFGAPFPEFDPIPSPSEIRRWVSATSAYPTPPGSGNAYARWFLDRDLPGRSGGWGRLRLCVPGCRAVLRRGDHAPRCHRRLPAPRGERQPPDGRRPTVRPRGPPRAHALAVCTEGLLASSRVGEGRGAAVSEPGALAVARRGQANRSGRTRVAGRRTRSDAVRRGARPIPARARARYQAAGNRGLVRHGIGLARAPGA